MKCLKVCRQHSVSCPNKNCRMWIDYEADFNCTLESIEKFDGKRMTLEEVGARFGLSVSRISQIEAETLRKLKNSKELFIIQ